MIKVLKYGVVIALLMTLVAGTIYIAARPAEARSAPEDGARRGSNSESAIQDGGRWASEGEPGGQGRWSANDVACDATGTGEGCEIESGQGRGQAGRTTIQEQGGYQGGQGANRGGGQGAVNASASETHDWSTVEGTVTVTGSELTVDTGAEEIVVGLGQAWYREEASFEVEVGDQVRIEGYDEDGEFKAGTVENLTTGATVTLRDATGRPMWAGRGNGQNRP